MRRVAIVVLLAACGSTSTDSGPPLVCPYQDPHLMGSNAPPFMPPTFHSGVPFEAKVTVPNPQVVSSTPVTLAIQSAENPAKLSGSTTLAPIAGVADFRDVKIDRWGKATVIASSPGFSSCTFDVVMRAGQYRFLTQPSNGTAGQALPAVQVALTDTTGSIDPDASEEVCWSTIGPETIYDVQNASFPAAGIVTLDHVEIDHAGTGYRLQLTSCALGPGDLTGAPSDPFNIAAGASNIDLSVSPDNSQAETMGADGSYVSWEVVPRGAPVAITAQLADQFHNPIAEPTTFMLNGLPEGPVFQATPSGSATFSGLSLDTRGAYTVTASASTGGAGSIHLWASAWEPRAQTLMSQFPNVVITGIAVSPDDPNTVWLASSAGVLVSHDGAMTFTQVSPVSDWFITADPTPGSHTLYLTDYTSFRRSTDSGATWSSAFSLADPFNELTKLVIDPSDPTRLFQVTDQSLWGSSDRGATWALIGPTLPDAQSKYWDVAVTSTGIAYATGWAGDGTALFWNSTDHGATWTALPVSEWIQTLWIDPYSSTIYATRPSWEANSHIGKSTDGGMTWTPLAPQGYADRAVFFPDHHMLASVFLSSTLGGTLLSTDDGQTWTGGPPVVNGMLDPGFVNFDSYAVAPSNPSIVYVIVTDGVWRTTTGGV